MTLGDFRAQHKLKTELDRTINNNSSSQQLDFLSAILSFLSRTPSDGLKLWLEFEKAWISSVWRVSRKAWVWSLKITKSLKKLEAWSQKLEFDKSILLPKILRKAWRRNILNKNYKISTFFKKNSWFSWIISNFVTIFLPEFHFLCFLLGQKYKCLWTRLEKAWNVPILPFH